MKNRKAIILPIVVFILGILAVLTGRQGQVGADIPSAVSANTAIYIFLMAAGFLLIAVAAIIALFMIASGEKK